MPAKLKPRTIGVLIFDDFQILDACGPIGAFEMPIKLHGSVTTTLKVNVAKK
jgi:ribosomal protein L9